MQKLIFLLGLFTAVRSSAQLAITGPACGIRGIQCQYLIAGTDTTNAVSICVNGGTIAGTTDSCITGINLTQLLITWDKPGITTGKITVDFNDNEQVLEVPVILELQAGVIDSAVKSQVIDSAAVPVSINCFAAQGGSCNPSYSYQWQWSLDNNTWANIDSATGQNLDFSTGIMQNTYFRRRVFESRSNTYGFSDVSAVFIKPVLTTSVSMTTGKEIVTVSRKSILAKGL